MSGVRAPRFTVARYPAREISVFQAERGLLQEVVGRGRALLTSEKPRVMNRPVGLVLFLVASLSVSACSFRLGDDSPGERGEARFQYSSGDCLFGCSMDRPALAGSIVTVVARPEQADRRLTARIAGGSPATIAEQRESCYCDDGDSSRNIEPGERCLERETKRCSLSVDVDARAPGDASLELTDPSGALVDRTTLRIRSAARVDLEVRADRASLAPAADGAFEVMSGAKVEIESTVRDAEGAELVFSRSGVRHAYADRGILAPDEKVLLGGTDVEYAVTGRAGETSVTVQAYGAETVARFRVR